MSDSNQKKRDIPVYEWPGSMPVGPDSYGGFMDFAGKQPAQHKQRLSSLPDQDHFSHN